MNPNENNSIRRHQFEFSPVLLKESSVFHFFTTRKGGESEGNYDSMNLSFFCGDDSVAVAENRKIVCEAAGIDTDRLIVPKEVHGSEIKHIDSAFMAMAEKERSLYLSACDAIITNLPGICLAVTTADCVPVLLYDRNLQVIAAVHAGWRGIVKEILPLTIRRMKSAYSSVSGDIVAVTGPCISVDYYMVNKDVVDEFGIIFTKKEMEAIVREGEGNTFYIDLRKAIFIQCRNENLPVENIEIHPGCTYRQRESYFSARRDSVYSGRMLSGIKNN